MLSKNGQIVDKRKKLFASRNPLKTPVKEKPNNYVLGRTYSPTIPMGGHASFNL